MKAEKRHELQQNELADWLGEQIEAAKPYAGTIAFVAIGVVVAVALVIYLTGAGNPASAGAWSQYFAAFNDREPAVALNQLAEEQPTSPVALWALQSVGDINLSQGSMELFSDREEAKRKLDKAQAAYTQVEAKATDPLLKSRARLGLAKLYESLNKPEEAKKFYQQVADTQKDSAVGKAAAQGVKRMSDPREVALLAWFAEQKPRKPAPFSGPGGLPGLPNDLPERPDLSLPGLGSPLDSPLGSEPGTPPGTGLNLEGLGTGKTEVPGLEFPKPNDKPAEKPLETPAEPTPGAAAPTAAPTVPPPAEPPPAETKPE